MAGAAIVETKHRATSLRTADRKCHGDLVDALAQLAHIEASATRDRTAVAVPRYRVTHDRPLAV